MKLADNSRLLADKAFLNLEDAAKRTAILGQVPLLARQTATSLSSQAETPQNNRRGCCITLEVESYLMLPVHSEMEVMVKVKSESVSSDKCL